MFSKRLQDLAGRDALDILRQIQTELLTNPERGSVLKGLGGVRKMRHSNPTRKKGKRGGYRCFFLYLKHRENIHLLLLLDKDEQEDLTNNERKMLEKIVEAIKQS